MVFFVEGYSSSSNSNSNPGNNGSDGYRKTNNRIRRPIRPRRQQPSNKNKEDQYSNNYYYDNDNEIQRQQQQEEEAQQQQQQQDQDHYRHFQALNDPTLLSNTKFSKRNDISPKLKRSIIEIMGLQQMTEIQLQTYGAILNGENVIGRGRTGTGKTLAYLIPTIERLLQQSQRQSQSSVCDLKYIKGQSIGMLIIAPTRELAIQISNEAEILVTYYQNEMNVACIYGGTKIQRDIRLLSGGGSSGSGSGGGGGRALTKLPAILVGTPGRLLEHMESNTRLFQGSKKFQDVIGETPIVVLDEADRLLDGSFYKDTTKILNKYLPRSSKRQTLLFSATILPTRKGFITKFLNNNNKKDDKIMKKNSQQFTYIDCVTTTTTTTTTGKKNDQQSSKNNKGKNSNNNDDDIIVQQQQQNKSSSTLTSTNSKTLLGGSSSSKGGEETSIRVDQTYYQLQSMDDYITTLVLLIYNHILEIRNNSDKKHNNQKFGGGCKILVFLPASKLVRFFYQFFLQSGLTEQLMLLIMGGDGDINDDDGRSISSSNSNMEVLEIHSRMSQSSRQKASNKFRSISTNKVVVLFSSDVSARGVDYPNVSLVIQYGAPANVDTYIHRLGRTGRAGQQGQGILVLLPFEKKYLKRIQRRLGGGRRGASSSTSTIRPLLRQKHDAEQCDEAHPISLLFPSSVTRNDTDDDDNSCSSSEFNDDDDHDHDDSINNNKFIIIQDHMKQTQLQIRSGHSVLTPSAVSAYTAFLAHYIASVSNNNNNFSSRGSSSKKNKKNQKDGGGTTSAAAATTNQKLKPSQIVHYANQFAICTGLTEPPRLDSKTISRLGIEGLVESEEET